MQPGVLGIHPDFPCGATLSSTLPPTRLGQCLQPPSRTLRPHIHPLPTLAAPRASFLCPHVVGVTLHAGSLALNSHSPTPGLSVPSEEGGPWWAHTTPAQSPCSGHPEGGKSAAEACDSVFCLQGSWCLRRLSERELPSRCLILEEGM